MYLIYVDYGNYQQFGSQARQLFGHLFSFDGGIVLVDVA